jgi:hypothetical protein
MAKRPSAAAEPVRDDNTAMDVDDATEPAIDTKDQLDAQKDKALLELLQSMEDFPPLVCPFIIIIIIIIIFTDADPRCR